MIDMKTKRAKYQKVEDAAAVAVYLIWAILALATAIWVAL